jgi:biotin synthase
MEEEKPVEIWEMIEWSPHRIIMPETQVRLSAGRNEHESRRSGDVLFAGANSIAGDKLLTTKPRRK